MSDKDELKKEEIKEEFNGEINDDEAETVNGGMYGPPSPITTDEYANERVRP